MTVQQLDRLIWDKDTPPFAQGILEVIKTITATSSAESRLELFFALCEKKPQLPPVTISLLEVLLVDDDNGPWLYQNIQKPKTALRAA